MKQYSVFNRANDWRMAPVWNDTIGNRSERPPQERARIWASELGKPPIEVFLKMRGVAASNPPNQRSRRKFAAGNLFEWVVSVILKRAGILKDAQRWVEFQYPGLVSVTGKIDFIAGGIPDYEQFETELKAMDLPEDFLIASEAVLDNFRLKYPEGLADKYLEIKSCSSFMMNSMEATGRSSKNHRLQLYHYLKAENFPFGLVVYICRDDLRMLEVEVNNPSDVEDEYRRAIEEITGYYEAHKKTPLDSFLVQVGTESEPKWEWNPAGIEGLPPLEKGIVWDEDLGKFARNWGVEYSSYLTMLYGYQTQLEFEEAVNPTVGRWNRVMSRMKKAEARRAWLAERGNPEVQNELVVVEGKKNRVRVEFFMESGARVAIPEEYRSGHELTPANVEVLKEIAAEGFNVKELLESFAGENGEENGD